MDIWWKLSFTLTDLMKFELWSFLKFFWKETSLPYNQLQTSLNNAKKNSVLWRFPYSYSFLILLSTSIVSSFCSTVNLRTKYLPSWGKLHHLKFQNKVVKQNVKKHSTNKTIQQLLLRRVVLSESDQNQVVAGFCHLFFCWT